MVGQVGVKNGTACILYHPGVDMLDIINIGRSHKSGTVGVFMFLHGNGCLVVPAAAAGDGHFHGFYCAVYKIQVCSFRHINIYIYRSRVNGREKFHWFFNADLEHPDLEQKDQDNK